MGIEGKMVAMTGFQRSGYDKSKLVTLFKDVLQSGDKLIEYTRKNLRSEKDIFNKGGLFTTIMKDKIFRLYHDNRRRIVETDWLKKNCSVDISNTLLDSEPLKKKNINHCKTLRFLSKFPITILFNKNNANITQTTYKNNLEVGGHKLNHSLL
jgi:hypothetical protein